LRKFSKYAFKEPTTARKVIQVMPGIISRLAEGMLRRGW
jgi:hypothetical protein